MKRGIKIVFLLAILLGGTGIFPSPAVLADFEWRVLKDLDLQIPPLDMAPSTDGQRLFILTAGEILIYSIQEERITDRIPVDKSFDRIASLPRADMITLASREKKSLQILILESVYKIDTTGLPFKGLPKAPVTIAVFTDYQ